MNSNDDFDPAKYDDRRRLLDFDDGCYRIVAIIVGVIIILGVIGISVSFHSSVGTNGGTRSPCAPFTLAGIGLGISAIGYGIKGN